MAALGGGRGRFTRFMSFVSLLCLIAAILYIVPASGRCDRIRRTVYVFNDIPANLSLLVLRPWAESSNMYWKVQDFFEDQRLVIANFMARQLHGQPSYQFMCVSSRSESEQQKH